MQGYAVVGMTALIQLLGIAFYFGGIRKTIEFIEKRVTSLETQEKDTLIRLGRLEPSPHGRNIR